MKTCRLSAARPAAALLLALGLCCADGCGGGSGMAKVHGKVTLDGQPVAAGAVNFLPVDGNTPTAGGVIKDGTYAAEVPYGSMRIEIRSPKAMAPPKPTAGPSHERFQEMIPPQFNSESKIVKQINASSSQLDFELKSTDK